MKYLVFSVSLNPQSRSTQMARAAAARLQEKRADVKLIDLSDWELPLCDGGPCYDHPKVIELRDIVAEADGMIVASPIYNYGLSSVAKNLLEITGRAWEEKVVGFICAAGGPSSYMSVMPFANSLMLDYRCVIVPRFVYATGNAFSDCQLIDPEVKQRLHILADALLRFTEALRS